MIEPVEDTERRDFWERVFLIILRQRTSHGLKVEDMAALADECFEQWSTRFDDSSEEEESEGFPPFARQRTSTDNE